MRLIKKIFFFLLLTFSLILIGLTFISYYYGDEIKALVVEHLNKKLKTKINISQVDFSVWNRFPYASVVFSDVVVFASESDTDSLLVAEQLSAEFSLLDLYKENYRLIGLGMKNGKCKLKKYANGSSNYIFWDSETTEEGKFSTQLENVSISDMDFSYEDLSDRLSIHFFIDQANLKGELSQSIFDLTLNTTLKETSISMGEAIIINDRTLFIYADGIVDQDKESLVFEDANLGIDAMNLKVKGEYVYADVDHMDLKLKSNNASLEKALALLPPSFRNDLSRFNISGDASFDGSIKGSISASSYPAYLFNFSVENGNLKDKESQLIFKNCRLSGTFEGTANKLAKSSLNISSFETEVNEGKLSGELQIKNFNRPQYKFRGDLNFDLASANQFFQWENISDPSGNIRANLALEGELSNMETYSLNDWKRSSIKGKVFIQKLYLYDEINALQFEDLNGSLDFTNNYIVSKDLHARVNGNELKLDGEFNNLIGFLLEDKESLVVDASLSSTKLNLKKLLNAPSNSNEETKRSTTFSLDPRLLLYLDLQFDSILYNTVRWSEFKGQLILSRQRLDIRNSEFKMAKGEVSADFFIRDRTNDLQFSSKSRLNNVDVKELFELYNNFGQSTLKAEHLSGNLNASINFYSEWSKALEIDLKSIKAETDILIDKGVLSNYQPLESLSKYIELEELRQVKFKSLKNEILIKDETIYIPRFNVFSSAINLSLAGTHTFKNEIDYQFTLRLKDVLGRKVKKPKESEFGYVEDEEFGGVKLFLKMLGTADNPEIKYDAGQLRKNISKSFSKEKETTKSLLKEEFGLFKKDSTIKPIPEEKRKRNPFQVEYDSSFRKEPAKKTESREEKRDTTQSKSKFGKFLDKIAKPNEEEYVDPEEN